MRALILGVLSLMVGCSPAGGKKIPCMDNQECPDGSSCSAGFCITGSGEIDAATTDSSGIDSSTTDAPTIDAMIDAPIDAAIDAAIDAPPTCPGGDNVCLVSCVATDPDCVTTCGDNKCVGNSGELCGNCPADCATMTVVCGNAACEAGEAPSCFADCGPTPWTWSAQETSLITLINNARTNGYTCPGGVNLIRPAYTTDTTMLDGAREWAWEIAHHNFFNPTAASCNGRTLAQRKLTSGAFTSYLIGSGYATPQDMFNAWMLDPATCAVVLQTTVTRVSAGIGFSTPGNGYVVLMK